MKLRILITNLTLASRTGTELYVRDVAAELHRRGHRPTVFTTLPGPLAEELREMGIEVVNNLAEVRQSPDVIHGHHYEEALAAVLSFPKVPCVYFCHDAVAKHDEALLHPRVRRYVAVSDGLRGRLLREGAPTERVHMLFSFVDMERFRLRVLLPERPRRALMFSNDASLDNFLPVVAKACHKAGLSLDAVGAGVGRQTDKPEELLGQYDVVFAKGKAALEAAAVGAAVVLCDSAGLGPLVTLADFDRLRGLNFGLYVLTDRITVEGILERLGRYDAADAESVSLRVRAEAGLDKAVDRLLEIYDEAIIEGAVAGVDSVEKDRLAALSLIRRLMGDLRALQHEHHAWHLERKAVRRLERLSRLPVIGRLVR